MTCIRGLAALTAVLMVLLAAPSGRAQQEPPPPANADLQDRPLFRGGTAFVYVDVYPRRDGRPIEGLTPADFEVFEDGKPQQVELFEFIRHETAVIDADRRDPTSQADGDRQAADPRNRVFVVYLDPYHASLEGGFAIRSAVMTFLQRAVGPTDLFGVMTPEIPPSQLVFGRRMETIDGDLQGFLQWSEASPANRDRPRTPVEEKLVGCGMVFGGEGVLIRAHRQDMLMTSLEGLMHRLRDVRDERKNVLFVSEGWSPLTLRAVAALGNRGGGGPPTIGVGPTGRLGTGSQQPYSADDTWCSRQFARLSSLDFEQRFRDLLRMARQANVTFYPLDLGGLRVAAGRGPRGTLLTLAENTDGEAVLDTNDTTTAARRLADSLSAYYLLGYYSSNAATDGRYREIEVRVRQPDVNVSARPGYFAPTPEILAAALAPRSTAPSAVDLELARLARTRPDTELFTHAVAGAGALRLVAELGSRLMAGGGWSGGADVRASLARPGGEPLTVNGRIEPGARATTVEVPLTDVGPGPWRVDVEVTAAAPARRGAPRSATGGPYESSLEVHAPPGPLFGEPMVFRANPSPRSPLKPVADFLYRRTERMHVDWPLLKALDAHEARLLDRAGELLPLTPVISERRDGVGLAIDLPLSALAEGDYVLELTGTGGADRERRLLAFRVIQ